MGRLTYHDFFLENWNKFFGSNFKKRPRAVVLPDEARVHHMALYGDIGTGKSRLIIALASYDAFRRVTGVSPRGFALLDNQEDLFTDVFDRLALLALECRQLYELVYIIDPTNEVWSIKYNPLELMPWETPTAKANQLAMYFMYLFNDDPNVHVRQYKVTSLSFLALILARKTLLDLPRFLIDRRFREDLVDEYGSHYPVLIDYWLREFPQVEWKAREWVESTMNRVERFIYMHEGISFMLEGPSTIDFREIMNKGAIVLVNAPIRVLKDSPSSVFLGFILAAMQETAMSRTNMPPHKRVPFTAYCDEYQEYTTPSIQQIIRLARKVKFEFLGATQDVKGLPKDQELREITRKLVGNTFAMRLSREDAEILADYLFTPGLVQEKAYVDGKPVFLSLPEIKEIEIRKITECPNQMLYWKRKGYPGSYYFRAPTVEDIEELPGYNRLAAARHELEMAAFRLAGQRKLKRLPEPRRDTRSRSTSDVRHYVPHWTR